MTFTAGSLFLAAPAPDAAAPPEGWGVLPWAIFGAAVVVLLVLDLAVLNRKSHEIGIREALLTSGFYIGLALCFNLAILLWKGTRPATDFLSGYLVEEALSADNLFVFLIIFNYFAVPQAFRHRVLFWGILGAVIMRGIFIAVGVTLIEQFHWLLYVFGAFLVFTGVKIALQKDETVHPERNPILRLLRRFLPITDRYEGGHFVTRVFDEPPAGGGPAPGAGEAPVAVAAPRRGRLAFTPLFVVLIVVETTDVLFALDSIPAVMGITQDPFIIFTSNIFAILGLRALYFALAGIMPLFAYLNYGLAFILSFIGLKMLIEKHGDHAPLLWFHVDLPPAAGLGVIAGTLALSVLASLVWPPAKGRGEAARAGVPPPEDGPGPAAG